MSTEQPSLRKDSDESLNELEKELAALRAENRKLQRALQEESLRHEACEELFKRAEPTYHFLVRINSYAKYSSPCHRGTVPVICAAVCSSSVITSA